jgi:hypothetical protein
LSCMWGRQWWHENLTKNSRENQILEASSWGGACILTVQTHHSFSRYLFRWLKSLGKSPGILRYNPELPPLAHLVIDQVSLSVFKSSFLPP